MTRLKAAWVYDFMYNFISVDLVMKGIFYTYGIKGYRNWMNIKESQSDIFTCHKHMSSHNGFKVVGESEKLPFFFVRL